jgi:hypothetical protein
MRLFFVVFILILSIIQLNSCKQKESSSDLNILYLHHSTGSVIWQGSKITILKRIARKIYPGWEYIIGKNARLPVMFSRFNKENNKRYIIREMIFPKHAPYGWNNYPYDYYNIWVKNAGDEYFMEEPTLEILTKQYNVIIFKHCFPVSNIRPDTVTADINSKFKTISNYKLQYNAIRDKLHEFTGTKFILFTGAVQVKSNIDEDQAIRAKEFFDWVRYEWDLPNDNIFLWDFYSLETEGGLYLLDKYALSPDNSHPNGKFAGHAVKLLFNRIVDIIENNGKNTKLTGEIIQ